MFKCKHCGNEDKKTLQEVKPIPPARNYNFIEIKCTICAKTSLIHIDD